MKAPRRPPDEVARLAALRQYEVLDTLPEQTLDDLTALAARICEAPISLISLIDEDRQWFKSSIGMSARETSRDISFCGHAILQPGLFIVPDALADERFADNPLVRDDPRLRFYAGAPLINADGRTLGALCVMDRVPRVLTRDQRESLEALGRLTMDQLELRRRTRALEANQAHLRALADTIQADIAERKRTELILLESNRRFTDMLSNIQLIAVTLDRQGSITFCNDFLLELTGWTREEVMQRSWFSTFLPASAVGTRAMFIENIDAGRIPAHYENPIMTRSGELRMIAWNNTMLRDSTGRITGTASIGEDVTDRDLAEFARRASEAQYRRLFECAPDGIVIADAKSTYLDANPAVCRMLGYTRDELIGLNAADIVLGTEVEHIEPALAEIRKTADYRREWKFRRKDGSVFSAEVIATTMPDGNLLGMIRDITERKQLEEQFFRAQRMESLGTLAGGIAHDLNNVLAPILLSVEMLNDLIRNEDDRELLDMLRYSAERGSALVKQVLTFARGVEGDRVTVNVLTLVEDLVRVLRDTFPKSIDVRLTPAEGLWPVTGDPTQMHQVFLNLCVNARDAMPAGGRLTLRAKNVMLDETYAAMHLDAKPGAYVRVTVADTGTGIAPEIRDRMFEPFFTTKEVGKGTGLGLSTSLAILKSHGGFIQLSTETGKGTRFSAYFPASAGEAAGTSPGGEATGLLRGKGDLVLVVDDEHTIRTIVQSTLERFGYRVLLAANGQEAVELYRRHQAQIAVVLTDMAMPVMDGIQEILALRSINPAVKIISSSGNFPVVPGSAGGVHLSVAKPYTAEALLSALRKVLEGDQEP